MTVSDQLDDAVRSAADQLAILLAESVWLVDTCGCSYDVAAASAGTTRQEMAQRVQLARRQIADRVWPHWQFCDGGHRRASLCRSATCRSLD